MADTSDLEAVQHAILPNTRLVHIETPGNPTTRVSDIAAIAEIAKNAGALLSVDSTFGSPYLQHQLALGVDFVVHSFKKYITSHGDALGGSVIGSKKLIDQIKRQDIGTKRQQGLSTPFRLRATLQPKRYFLPRMHSPSLEDLRYSKVPRQTF